MATDRHRRQADLNRLRDAITNYERRMTVPEGMALKTGLRALDQLFPFGLTRGSLVEFLHDRTDSGGETVAVHLCRAAAGERGLVVILDRERQFYPPAAVAWGLPWDSLVILQPATDSDELWAADLALRSPAVAAVWLRRKRLNPSDYRRLQLAAEQGGTLGIVFRPIQSRGQPTWADVQLLVEPQPGADSGRVRVEVTRRRGGSAGTAAMLDLDGAGTSLPGADTRETLPLHPRARLAGSAIFRGQRGGQGPAAAAVPTRPAAR